jgi:outer membrane PBP1 activator LpoA protein
MRRHDGPLYDRLVAAVAMLTVLAACANEPPPHQEVAAADLAVQTADALIARSLASEELGAASWKLDEARAALAAGQHEQARRLAEQALVDAELAEAKARAAAAERRATQLRDSLHDLDPQAAWRPTGS